MDNNRKDGGGRKAGGKKGTGKKTLEKPAAIQLGYKLKEVLLDSKSLYRKTQPTKKPTRDYAVFSSPLDPSSQLHT